MYGNVWSRSGVGCPSSDDESVTPKGTRAAGLYDAKYLEKKTAFGFADLVFTGISYAPLFSGRSSGKYLPLRLVPTRWATYWMPNSPFRSLILSFQLKNKSKCPYFFPSSSSTCTSHSTLTSSSKTSRSLGPSTPISIMAVIDGIPHVTARIRVAGELATEYDVPDDVEMIAPNTEEDTTPSKHCYIECKSGAEFAIDFTVSPGFKFFEKNDIIRVNTFIDGARICSLGVNKHELGRQVTRIKSTTRCHIDKGRAEIKKFMFTSITKSMSRWVPLRVSTKHRNGRFRIQIKDRGRCLAGQGLRNNQISRFHGQEVKETVKPTFFWAHHPPSIRFCGESVEGQRDKPCDCVCVKPSILADLKLTDYSLAATGDIIPNRRIINIENRINLGEFFFHYRSHGMAYTSQQEWWQHTDYL